MRRKRQKANRMKTKTETGAYQNEREMETTGLKLPKHRKIGSKQDNASKVQTLSKYCLQLQKSLKDAAMEKCAIKSENFLQLHVRTATLKGNRRQFYEDYNRLPTKLKNYSVTSSSDEQIIYSKAGGAKGDDSIKIPEMFEAAKKFTETMAAKLPDSAKEEFLLQHKNSVAIVGQSGIGKTTICKYVTNQVLDQGFVNLPKVDWLFYIAIQDVDFQTEITLLDFLLSNSGSVACKHHEMSNDASLSILKSIVEGSNVMIILDGLDRVELPSDSSVVELKNLSEKFSPIRFVQGLVKGELMVNAKKIFTTTQKHFKNMGQEFWPMFVIEVLGWNESTQKQACAKVSGKTKQKVLRFVSEHSDISPYCSNPAQCIVIYSAVCTALTAGEEMLLNSIYQIYLYGLCKCLHPTSKVNKIDVEQLSLLSWNNGNLKTADIKVLNTSVYLCTKRGQLKVHLVNGTNPLHFSSSMWRDLFSALYQLFVTPLSVFKDQLQNLKLQKWHNLTKFIFALCNEQLVELLAKTVLSTADKYKWDCRRDLLHNHFSKQLRKLSFKNGNSMLKMLSYFYEVNNDEFLRELVKYLPQVVVISGPIAPSNVIHIEKALSLSDKNHCIHILSSAKFLGESFKILLGILKSNPIQEFHLQKDLSDEELEIFLDIPSCPADKLAISLSFPESFLEKTLKTCSFSCVDLSGSCIRSSTISLVAGYVFRPFKLLLPKVVVTYCREPRMSMVDVSKVCQEKWNNVKPSDRKSIEDTIVSELVEVRNPVKQLRPIGNVVTCALSLVLDKIPLSTLDIDQAAPFAIQQMAEAIKHLPYKLDTLKFDGNKVNGKCACAISECICNARALSLYECHLNSDTMETVAVAVSKNDHMFESVILDHNELDDKACAAVSTALSKIKVLSMQFCHISCPGMKHIATAILNLIVPMQSFTLGWNEFPDEMADDIGSCIGNIQNLSLRGCGVSAVGMEKIASSIACLKTPMLAFDISRVYVSEAVAETLTTCLHNIEQLTVSSSHIFGGKEIIEKKLQSMPEPCFQMLFNMGCNFSKQAVKIVHRKTSDLVSQDASKNEETEGKSEQNGLTVIPASSPPSTHSYLKSSILAPHKFKSVELKNGVVCNDNPPVAMATIIRGASEPLTPNNNTHTVTLQLPHQADDLTSTTPVKKTVVITRPLGARKTVSDRRSSDGDVNVKSSNPTCVTRPFGKDGLPVGGGSLPDLQKQKTRSSPFGPRNSKLVLTQSQVDFFRMLDEKVAQGKDYCSEDDQSLASMHSWRNPRKDSSSSNGISFNLMQGVR